MQSDTRSKLGQGRRNNAQVITDLLGGPKVLSEVCNVRRTQVWRWSKPKTKGGTGGQIPRWHHRAIRSYAREHQIDLPVWLFLEDDIE